MIRRLYMTAIFTLLALPLLAQNNYVTSFPSPPAPEDPISESGHWINGSVVGFVGAGGPHVYDGNWTAMQTSAGLAYGTQDGSNGPPYTDSVALLTGNWNPVQTVKITVHANPNTLSQDYPEEVEIHLRSYFASGTYTGYELNCRVGAGGHGYFNVGVFAGAQIGSVDTSSGGGCNDGDVITASVDASDNFHISINGVARQFYNMSGQIVSTLHDSTYGVTYCNAHPGQCNPGMGTYMQCNGVGGCGAESNANFGVSRFTATDGTGSAVAPPTGLSAVVK